MLLDPVPCPWKGYTYSLGSLFIFGAIAHIQRILRTVFLSDIASCNILDRGLGYCRDHLVWVWSYPLLCFNFVEQHLVRVGRFPFALKLKPHRLPGRLSSPEVLTSLSDKAAGQNNEMGSQEQPNGDRIPERSSYRSSLSEGEDG